MARATNGSCLCGGVRYRVDGPLRDVLQCHCHRCQKVTGNFMAASGAPLAAITFDAESTLTWYSPADDPNVAYGFCARCGSSLFWRLVDQGDDDVHVSICAGTFDDAEGLRTTEIWFAEQAAAHTPLDPTIARSTDR
ncbi:MAG: GFA family protein [Ilumatobacter sp.]|nr:GFA family protein [Ilumatobacter sp.]